MNIPSIGRICVDPLTDDELFCTTVSPPHRGANGETPPEPVPTPEKKSHPLSEITKSAIEASSAVPAHPVPAQSVVEASPPAKKLKFLGGVTRGRTRQALRILSYGPGGIGKSYQASLIPNHISMDLEQGSGHLRNAVRMPTPTSMEEVRAALIELANEQHDFTTLVIDSADRLEVLIEREVCEEAGGKSSLDKIEYGKGPGLVASKWDGILTWLTRLWEKRGMNIVLIAHDIVTKYEDPMYATYDKHQIRLGKKSAPVVFEWADLVLFANYKRHTVQEEVGFDKIKNRVLLGTTERVWYTQDHPAAAAKSRISLPVEIPMDWMELQRLIEAADKEK